MMILTIGLALAGLQSAYLTCKPMVEDEFQEYKVDSSLRYDNHSTVIAATVRHKCLGVDEKGLQHIELEYIEGTKKEDDDEAESMVGETGGYFLNTVGQRVEYEVVRITLKDDPLGYIMEVLETPLRRRTVTPGNKFLVKEAHIEYEATVSGPIKMDNKLCILVTRVGKFVRELSGEFKTETYYRTDSGLMQLQKFQAWDVQIGGRGNVRYDSTVRMIYPK